MSHAVRSAITATAELLIDHVNEWMLSVKGNLFVSRVKLCVLQMRWMRRNKFSVGRNFFGWAVENGTVYIAGGRLDSRTSQCSSDVLSLSAERLVRGCESPCDAVNDPGSKPTPWRIVGRLPSAMCIFAHCVVTLPIWSDETAPTLTPSPSMMTTEEMQTRPKNCTNFSVP